MTDGLAQKVKDLFTLQEHLGQSTLQHQLVAACIFNAIRSPSRTMQMAPSITEPLAWMILTLNNRPRDSQVESSNLNAYYLTRIRLQLRNALALL